MKDLKIGESKKTASNERICKVPERSKRSTAKKQFFVGNIKENSKKAF